MVSGSTSGAIRTMRASGRVRGRRGEAAALEPHALRGKVSLAQQPERVVPRLEHRRSLRREQRLMRGPYTQIVCDEGDHAPLWRRGVCYPPRVARTIGIRAARMAGKRPPKSPSKTAKTSPRPAIDGVSVKRNTVSLNVAKFRVENDTS